MPKVILSYHTTRTSTHPNTQTRAQKHTHTRVGAYIIAFEESCVLLSMFSKIDVLCLSDSLESKKASLEQNKGTCSFSNIDICPGPIHSPNTDQFLIHQNCIHSYLFSPPSIMQDFHNLLFNETAALSDAVSISGSGDIKKET